MLPRRSIARLGGLVVSAVLYFLSGSNIVFAVSQGRSLEPFLGPSILFGGLATVALLWSLRRPEAAEPARRGTFWSFAAKVVGTILLAYGGADGVLTTLVLGEGPALVSASLPIGAGIVLWFWGAMATPIPPPVPVLWTPAASPPDRSLGPPSAPAEGSPSSVPPATLAPLYEEIRRSGVDAFRIARRLMYRVTWTILAIYLAPFGLLAAVVLPHPGADLLPLAVLILAALIVVLVVVALRLGWRQLDREVDSGRFPPLDWLEQPPLVAFARWVGRVVFHDPPRERSPAEEPNTLSGSVGALRFAHRMARSAEQSAKFLFVAVFLVAGAATYITTMSVLLRYFGGLSEAGRDAGVSVLAALGVAGLAFYWLYRMLRDVDRLDRRLDALVQAEQSLEAEFWARF
ncbi:MAG TPA: hypothetical protein VGV64_07645 [Thermoplasmata archaeon]|nr:hypothetical protein [Thermoplasmata archaeon]